MAQLLNNETLVIGGGTYGVKSTGSLDVQWQIGSEAQPPTAAEVQITKPQGRLIYALKFKPELSDI
tara:strand:- start:1540 stop:1737 length:198 start_codon:yes stop_codon:yes gene_type:complete